MRIGKDELRGYLEKTQKALVVGHVKPDGDAVGSVLALTEALRARGVTADPFFADPVATKFDILPLVQDVLHELPQPFPYDTIFFLDLSTKDRAGEIDWPQDVPIVNIDHHVSNPDYADALYLQAEAAAVGEILTALFLEWDWPITATMAQALYTAIATDCGFFKFSNTSERTLALAGKLRGLGAEPQRISQAMDSLPRTALEILPQVMGTLTFAADGQVSYITMDAAAMEAGRDYVDTYLDLARNVEGVELTLQFKYAEPCKTYVSFRSQRRVDVSALAAKFGGGGHIRASGCTIAEDLASARAQVVAAAEEVFRHAGNR